MKFRVAILDDEVRMVEILRMMLVREGYDAVGFASPGEFLQAFSSEPFDLLVTDLKMSGQSGLDVLQSVRAADRNLPVILMTAHATIATAVRAMRDGAFDYVEKPFDNEEIKALVRRALEMTGMARQNRYLRAELRSRYSPERIIAASAAMQEVLARCRRVAATSSTVLITGPSGTGKELVARAIHYWSDRVDAPFLAVNCAAFAEGVLESELFGHERGAFTGATGTRPGVFERSNGGTLFLDEIGEVSEAFQAKLLRVLQEKEVTRVGGATAHPVRVRVIAATHRNLLEEVRAGRFREDFYFRLAVVPMSIPPLRERREDVPLLARHFLLKYNEEFGRSIEGFAPEVWERFEAADWPGNVRELENTVQRGVVLAAGRMITAEDLWGDPVPARLREETDTTLQGHPDRAATSHIRAMLGQTGGSRSETAQRLGIDRTTLYRLMRKYRIEEPGTPE